jgi:nickel-dependent lactate racemase
VADPLGAVAAALDAPVGGVALDDWRGVRSVAIAINDKTRPVPHAALLPPLLARIEALGVPPEAITLILATGTHPAMLPAEFGQVVPPDVLARYPVISHDCDVTDDLVHLGATPLGTPVWLNCHFVEADLRIVVGNIAPHQFMGFSGGVKSAAIGLAGRATINANHARMTEPGARLGAVDGNPARADVEEIGRLAGVHFALNAVLNRHKEIAAVVAGEPGAVMTAGIPQARAICQVAVAQPYDLVIAAPGGHPKDINVYQAQKALAHAALITRPGGWVIVAAACPEGTGSRGYETWLTDAALPDHAAVLARFAQEPFRAGPHKAYQIARDAVRVHLRWVSELPLALAQRLLLTPAPSLDAAVQEALAALPPDARIAVLPQANATAPFLSDSAVHA